jgi:predicted transcriptional regulator
LEELRKSKEAIMQPVTAGSVFKKTVYSCFTNDSLKEVMINMKNFGYTHVPVFNEKHQLQ